MNPLLKILETPGMAAKLSRELGVSAAAVYQWKLLPKVLAERVLDIERVTGVSRHDLRPDLYSTLPAPAPRRLSMEADLSLRDWFAGQALAGLCARSLSPRVGYPSVAYELADIMLTTRLRAEASREREGGIIIE